MQGTGTSRASVWSVALVSILLASAAVAGPALAGSSAASQEQPRAEAGVDQDVTRGATVLLDATESWSPAGDITYYEWTITSPLNETIGPDCEVASCRLANFPAPAMGTYEVELTVEDEAGQTARDTMYVETAAANEFDVELDGPDSAGDVTLTADVDAGNATLQWLTWVDEDGVVANESLSGLGQTHEFSVDADPGEAYAVAVQSADGRVVGDTWTAPVPGSVTQDYPYIEGPLELTGDADYDDDRDRYVFRSQTYRVVTSDLVDAEEVTWSRDREAVGKGRTFTDHFEAGKHQLTATVTYAKLDVEFDVFDQVGGDVSKGLGSIIDDDTARETVVADPQPQFHRMAVQQKGSTVSIVYNIEEPNEGLEHVTVRISGQTVSRDEDPDREADRDFPVQKPPNVEGRSPVTITAVDEGGQKATETAFVTFPTSENGQEGGKDPRRIEEEEEEAERDQHLCRNNAIGTCIN